MVGGSRFMTKTGRGRFYQIKSPQDFADRDIGISIGWIDEYRERVFDQIEDLPSDALNHEAPGTGITIGRLVLHMAWAEALWVGRISGLEAAPDLAESLAPGSLSDFENSPPDSPDSNSLISLGNRVRDEMTLPGMKDIKDADAVCWSDGSTYRGVLGQLQWHWIYHSGQIGLIRFEWGSDYQWTMAGPMAPEPKKQN